MFLQGSQHRILRSPAILMHFFIVEASYSKRRINEAKLQQCFILTYYCKQFFFCDGAFCVVHVFFKDYAANRIRLTYKFGLDFSI